MSTKKWYPRSDSNRHCANFKSADSNQLAHVGIIPNFTF